MQTVNESASKYRRSMFRRGKIFQLIFTCWSHISRRTWLVEMWKFTRETSFELKISFSLACFYKSVTNIKYDVLVFVGTRMKSFCGSIFFKLSLPIS